MQMGGETIHGHYHTECVQLKYVGLLLVLCPLSCVCLLFSHVSAWRPNEKEDSLKRKYKGEMRWCELMSSANPLSPNLLTLHTEPKRDHCCAQLLVCVCVSLCVGGGCEPICPLHFPLHVFIGFEMKMFCTYNLSYLGSLEMWGSFFGISKFCEFVSNDPCMA